MSSEADMPEVEQPDTLSAVTRQDLRIYPVLLGVEGPLANQRFALDKKIITLGRDMVADILLKDNKTSRRHAHVIYGNILQLDQPPERFCSS